ncbi:MAG: M20/M25/M40 family metallo-hydrolase [Armatimonadota bacterium]|nr:M20/M25/M40 family metallo-hydrolase [Armatimonadota bacterium]
MAAEPVSVNQDRLVQTFLELARKNTPPRQEREASEIAHWTLMELGFQCEFDDAGEKVGGNVGNLIAFKKGTIPDAPPIFFSSHFDTVEPTPGLEPIIDGDIIKSDGKTIVGADDKCGVAPILEAMRILDEQAIPHGDIQLLLTICEEIGLVGAKNMDPRRIKAKYGYVLDSGPPIGSFVYSAPTQDIFEVWIHGKPSHAGALPEDGISAIQVAARAIARMKLGRIGPDTTANVGIITGGNATNIIPAECYLKCEARSRSQEKLDKQRDHMIACFEEEAAALGATVDIRNENAYQTYELGMEDSVLKIGLEACDRIGLESLLRVTGGGADANIFNAMGFPTTVLGCGMVNIHRHDEYVRISDMVKSTQLVVSIVQTAADWRE